MVRLEEEGLSSEIAVKRMGDDVMAKFKVEYSTALGHEGTMTVEASNTLEAETTVKGRIRVERIHSVTPT